MPTVHLICGQTGAGKTTYARAFAAKNNIVRFSLDEWFSNLFIADLPEEISFEWNIDRIQRCQLQIRQTAEQILACGHDVVMDMSFDTREQRDRYRTWAINLEMDSRLHYVKADPAIRWQRTQQRNRDRNEVFVFEVTKPIFDFMEQRFEEPGPDEQPMEVTSDALTD